MQLQDSLNYLLGQYIAFAFNSPKKYPKEAFLIKEAKRKNKFKTNTIMSDQELEAFGINFAKKYERKESINGRNNS